MSSDTDTGPDEVPRVECAVCEVDVPAGAFCGLCGGHLTPKPRRGPKWLRQDTRCGSQRECVAAVDRQLAVPAPADRSRTPFRIGLVPVLVGLVVSPCSNCPPP